MPGPRGGGPLRQRCKWGLWWVCDTYHACACVATRQPPPPPPKGPDTHSKITNTHHTHHTNIPVRPNTGPPGRHDDALRLRPGLYPAGLPRGRLCGGAAPGAVGPRRVQGMSVPVWGLLLCMYVCKGGTDLIELTNPYLLSYHRCASSPLGRRAPARPTPCSGPRVSKMRTQTTHTTHNYVYIH